MQSAEVRRTFLEYFREKGHVIMPSSSLIPYGDPTLLLTSAGMVQMKPFFLGEATPPGKRLTTSQKCFRTTDIEQVGNQRSLTFFEMLGNFSVGDYFKEGAIEFAWELSTQRYGIPAEDIWVTVHPEDDEAPKLWREIVGMPEERIVIDPENWWGPAGETGPCGPDSELYLDRGSHIGCGRADCRPGCDCERFLEFWNLVFMQYYQDITGHREPLAMQNIDTGLGLERMSLIKQGTESVYETDLFTPVIERAESLANVAYADGGSTAFSLRVIADHSRAVAFLIGDGVLPGNEGRGYILRRVLRRAVRHGRLLGIERPFLRETVNAVIDKMKDAYPELAERRAFIDRVVEVEEARFNQTLSVGLHVLQEMIANRQAVGDKQLPGADVFKLHDTFGFPRELTEEVAAEQGMTIDLAGFETAMSEQREHARKAAKFGLTEKDDLSVYQELPVHDVNFVGYEQFEADSHVVGLLAEGEVRERVTSGEEIELVLGDTPYYAEGGGQVADTGTITTPTGRLDVRSTSRPTGDLIVHRGVVSEGEILTGQPARAMIDVDRRYDTMRNHTATHLLHKALREVLGEHVQQSGSYVGPDRLRFDFNHFEPVSKSELREISERVNAMVRLAAPVRARETTYREAVAAGAMALFGEKYGDQVRMISIGDVSNELCGGTHLSNTGQIGLFEIIAEGSVGAGLRRIEAITGRVAEDHFYQQREELENLRHQLGSADPSAKVKELIAENNQQRRLLQQLQRQQLGKDLDSQLAQAVQVGDNRVLALEIESADREAMRELGDKLKAKLGRGAVLLLAISEGKPTYLAMSTKGSGIHAGNLVKRFAAQAGGGGGGGPELGQAGGGDPQKARAALSKISELLTDQG